MDCSSFYEIVMSCNVVTMGCNVVVMWCSMVVMGCDGCDEIVMSYDRGHDRL